MRLQSQIVKTVDVKGAIVCCVLVHTGPQLTSADKHQNLQELSSKRLASTLRWWTTVPGHTSRAGQSNTP